MKELNIKDFNIIETNDKIEGLKKDIVNYTKYVNKDKNCEQLNDLLEQINKYNDTDYLTITLNELFDEFVIEILLKQTKDHKWTAVESDRPGLYHIKFYEYYNSVGFKYLSIDKDYWPLELALEEFK